MGGGRGGEVQTNSWAILMKSSRVRVVNVCFSVLQCVAVCCSALQCVAVRVRVVNVCEHMLLMSVNTSMSVPPSSHLCVSLRLLNVPPSSCPSVFSMSVRLLNVSIYVCVLQKDFACVCACARELMCVCEREGVQVYS